MKIVKAVLDNSKDIANIEFNSGYQWSRYSLEKEIKLAKRLLDNGQEDVFLAKENKGFVGYVQIRIENKLGEIGMSVLKDFQGKGIGSKLMSFIIGYAKDNGCKKLKGELWEGNHKSINLNKKFGFVVKSEKKNFYKNGDSLLCMELKL